MFIEKLKSAEINTRCIILFSPSAAILYVSKLNHWSIQTFKTPQKLVNQNDHPFSTYISSTKKV